MGASQSRRPAIAIDTNVLLDLTGEVDDVTDALLVIRRRLHEPQLLMPPTVREELAAEALHGEDFDKSEKARLAFQGARSWNIQPVDLLSAQYVQARDIGRRL
jgi:hypothetical protein